MRQFHATVHGRGEPVLFLPGGGFTESQGQLFAEALHNDFEVHLTYRISRHLEAVRLIGHSMGAAIALAYAVHYPDQVRHLILLDQGHKPNAMLPYREYGIFGFALPLLRLLYHHSPRRLLNWIETKVIRVTTRFLKSGSNCSVDESGSSRRYRFVLLSSNRPVFRPVAYTCCLVMMDWILRTCYDASKSRRTCIMRISRELI